MEDKKENKRKAIFLTIVAVITLIALVVGATYAYFQAQVGTGKSTTLNVKAGTTDDLSFSLSDLNTTKEKVVDNDTSVPIVIEANQTNFANGENSIADGVTGTAMLIANDENYQASETYNVYLNITKNELKYSSYIKKVPDETPENILSFKDETKKAEADLSEYNPRPELYLTIKQNGEEVSDGVTINDKELNYSENIFTKDDTQLGGFDITETKGLIKISVPTEIKVENGSKENHTTTDTWEITVTFMNLDTDQNLNTGKSVIGEVLIQSEYIKTLAIACKDAEFANCAAANYKLDSFLIKHDGKADYDGMENSDLEAGDDSIRYTGGNIIISEEAASKIVNDLYDTDKICQGDSCEELYWLKENSNAETIKKGLELTKQIINGEKQFENLTPEDQELWQQMNQIESNGEILQSKEDSLQDAIEKNLVSNYEGVKILNNYVCLDGKTVSGTCTSDDDLYRIIGFFKNENGQYETKLIKSTYATTKELGDADVKADGDSITPSAYDDSDESQYFWNSTFGAKWDANNSNMWKESNLNKVNLNGFYYKYITNKVKKLDSYISMHEWQVGGFSEDKKNVKEIYDLELGINKIKPEDNSCYDYGSTSRRQCNQQNDLTYNAPIGLMYESDYRYGILSKYWTSTTTKYIEHENNNWMYLGSNKTEWTISRSLNSNVNTIDGCFGNYCYTDGLVYISYYVRPCFYLIASTILASGTGSYDEPYRLSFDMDNL